ncbi:MAG: SCP-like extracellular [Thermoleophilia bacterium]|nr:SCP-like extracellular [Thermoleophilia bacterium]
MINHRRTNSALHNPLLLAAIIACLAAFLLAFAPRSAAAATRATAIDAAEVSQVRMINRFRAARGLRALRVDARLTRAATWMAIDMGRRNYFSHTDSARRDPFRRIAAFGYPTAGTWRGENIAAGNASVFATYKQWLNSPPHRANWLKPNYRTIGIARVYAPGSQYRWYWVTDFG